MNFSNTQIHSETFPNIEDVVLKPISKQYLTIIIINNILKYAAIFGVLLAGQYIVKNDILQNNYRYLFLIVFLFCACHFILALLAFKKLKYAIREHDVIYAKGLIVNSITTVPISRIQHTETSRSWLARKFHLATLNIYTAGESGSDLSIKGLPNDEAQQINDFLSDKVNGNN
jgi:membrane protein YdbS with pleckstrin-like domain